MIIDLNTSIGPWPFCDLPANSAAALVNGLQKYAIDEAYVSHLGAVFNLDPTLSNRNLIEETGRHDMLHPVVTVNPAMPGWQKHLDHLATHSAVRMVKIYPQYHNYSLRDTCASELVTRIQQLGLNLLVCMRLEDERTRYFGLDVTGVPIEDVVDLHQRHPDFNFICLNAYLPEIRTLAEETRGIGVDTSFADWFLVMEELVGLMPVEHIHFGSHSPFLYTGASVAKVIDSRIGDSAKRKILSDNTIAYAKNLTVG